METGNAGIKIITKYEGLALKAYKDSGGHWTVGYGHRIEAQPGLKITKAEAIEFLKKDLVRFEKAVNEKVTRGLNQYEFDALVSFAFNLGAGQLSGDLLDAVNSKATQTAVKLIKEHNHADGKVLSGLTKRRNAEALLYSGDTASFYARMEFY
jgi:lysozyme